MPWTATTTFSTTQIVTAAQMNAYVRDDLDFLHTFHGARMWQSGALSQTSQTNLQLVTWDSLDYDTDTIASVANDNFKVPSGFDGTWRITAQVEFAAAATIKQVAIAKNETYTGRTPNGAGTVVSINRHGAVNNTVGVLATWTGPLVANDTISIQARQDSGGNLAFDPGQSTLWVEAYYLGA